MRVHFDGRVFEKQTHGGISRVFTNLLRELEDFKEVEAYLHLEASVQPPVIPASIKVVRTPTTHNLRPTAVFNKLNQHFSNRSQRRQYESFGSGIFHSTYYSVSPSSKLKQVFTLHDMIFEDYPEYFDNAEARECHILEKQKCIEQADVIVCVSDYTKQRLGAHYPDIMTAKLIKVIHLGPIVPDQRSVTFEDQPGFFDDHGPYILHVGSRHSHKNFMRLISAMSHGDLSELKLVSVGGGVISSDELKLLKQLGLRGRVQIIPKVTETELATAYRSASVVAVPSITEGFGLPLLEALQFGCSVACSTGGSLPEVGGGVPAYFDPFDESDLVRAIVEALSKRESPEQENEAINRAQQFSWRKCASSYVEVYKNILELGTGKNQ